MWSAGFGRAACGERSSAPTNASAANFEIGVDIPAPAEIRKLIAHLDGRWRPLVMTAIFTGLRASELRGLRWSDVDLKRNELHVRQRADYYREIGALKSEAGERTIRWHQF